GQSFDFSEEETEYDSGAVLGHYFRRNVIDLSPDCASLRDSKE
ncbi:hypothetical protein E3A20_22420, partial [Planctomyces bekefii]